ncbi:MAG: hypothetical protein AB1791_17040 [Chloroflexota bacterium]
MHIILPPAFSQQHEQALTNYLADYHRLNTAAWQQLQEGINLLAQARVEDAGVSHTFGQLYDTYVDRPLADPYIDQLLTSADVKGNGPALIAGFARQISSALEKAHLLQRDLPESWLLFAYCVYRWQSFARGYAFEVEIMRDLAASRIRFQMHNLRSRLERYSSADLTVLGLLGDIKTSTYFLGSQTSKPLPNDFYITRLHEKGYRQTVVVFQKPFAWEVLGGETPVSGDLKNVLALLPGPVRLKQRGIILIVVEYDTWKQKVLQKQVAPGA